MKKQLLFLIAILFACSAEAQWSFGLQGGVNHSLHTQALRRANEKTPRLKGLNTTLMVYKKVGKYLEIGIEPGVSQRGAESSVFTIVDDGTIFFPINILINAPSLAVTESSLQANYLQLPIYAKVNLPLKKDRLAFFVKAGGGPSWLSEAHIEKAFMAAEGYGPIAQINFDETPELNRWDWGVYGSTGLQVKVGPGHVTASVDSYNGLNNIVETRESKNQSVGYSLGYIIQIK